MVENKACFSRNVSTFSRPLAGGACCMAAHRVGGRMGDIFTAHEGRKKQYDSEGIGAADFSRRGLLLAAAAFFAFSPSSADEVANATTQKRPRRESTPLMGVFLAAGESRKSHFVLTSRARLRGLRRSARHPWRRKRCRRRSPPLHRRGKVRRGVHAPRFRCRAPRERAKRCAFRRR